MENRIVIIDGNSLINRAYYAVQRPMITKEGIYTQGIFGFINMLTKILDEYNPSYITVAFDLKAPTFRHLEYDAYKAGRKAMPPELAMQMPIMKDVLHAMNIKTLELEGFEADDIIGTVSLMAENSGIEPLIITGDRDALQLCSQVTKVLITRKGITDFDLFDHDKMIERYNLTPTQFIDLKGLMGDSSDNIPGIPGVGEKTGIQLLEQFGSIENLLARTEEISRAKLREKVEENAQLAVMSKRLATINRYVPIEIGIEELKRTEPDYGVLVPLYQKLEFNSFLKKIKITPDMIEVKAEDADAEISAFVPFEPETVVISDINELVKLDELKNSECFIRVTGDFAHVGKPDIENVFLMNEKTAFLISADEIGKSELAEKLSQLSLKLCGHDIKNDIYALMCYGFTNFETAFDTAVCEYVLDPSRSKYDFNTLALEYLKMSPSEAEEEQVGMFTDPAETFMKQYVEEGNFAFGIRQKQIEAIKAQGLEEVLYNVELPLIEVMASMEVEGIDVSRQFLDEAGRNIKEKVSELENSIYELAGEKFNIKSTQQLGVILFEKLGLPAGKKTKTGYSTNAETLEKIKDKHEIIPMILEYRNLTKLDSTYIEGMKPLIGPDGKIHAHFQQTVTATGRISCTEPNLQNIPVRQELGRQLRKAFTAGEGCTLVGADYSQIELRVLAHLSQDEALIESFNKGEDIHRRTASRVLGIPFEEVTSLDRSRAKAVNFGVIYGMSSFGLSEEIKVSTKEAAAYIKDYFDKHVKVKEYMDNQKAMAKEKGYSLTILGRKRPIPEISASNFMVRQLGERLAMNSPIQGSAADIIKLAMIKVYKALKEGGFKSALILQVHDELIIRAVAEELEAVKELLTVNMEEAMKLSVKLSSELNTGETWYDLK